MIKEEGEIMRSFLSRVSLVVIILAIPLFNISTTQEYRGETAIGVDGAVHHTFQFSYNFLCQVHTNIESIDSTILDPIENNNGERMFYPILIIILITSCIVTAISAWLFWVLFRKKKIALITSYILLTAAFITSILFVWFSSSATLG